MLSFTSPPASQHNGECLADKMTVDDDPFDISWFKKRLEASLSPINRSDLEGVTGINEMSFKMAVLGVLSEHAILGNFAVVSEEEVFKCESIGYCDLVLEMQYKKVLLELKYLSLAYVTGLDSHKLHRPSNYDERLQHWEILRQRKTRFVTLTPSEIMALRFVGADGTHKSVKDIINQAKTQVCDYEDINDPHCFVQKYIVVGVGTKVFIEKCF